MLGRWYFSGDGVEKNIVKAVEWLQGPAEDGVVDAQALLSVCYDYGGILVKNKEKAVEWCRKAAEGGSALAQYFMGMRYEAGSGVERSREKALEWYTKAAEQNDNDAKKAIKRILSDGMYNAILAKSILAGVGLAFKFSS